MNDDVISRRAAIYAMCELMDHWFGADSNDEKREIKMELGKLPSVQPDDAALHESCTDCPLYDHDRRNCPRFNKVIPTAIRDAQPRWIPFETREPDAEEKQEHPEWDFVLCGKLPQDGQRILVNIKYKGHEAVQMDEYNDDGRECYLYSGYDIATEATAWMPLPEPWRGEEHEL